MTDQPESLEPQTSPERSAKAPARTELIPRFDEQGYSDDSIAERRRWIEERTGANLSLVGATGMSGESMRGNVENVIGAAQVPIGIAGPLDLHGEHARGTFYVPIATTEGAIVRSYERGMVAISRAGGATARVVVDANQIAPFFRLDDVAQAVDFAREIPSRLEELAAAAQTTTRHGRLLDVQARPIGRGVIVCFRFHTADASGMNMVVKAADAACRVLAADPRVRGYSMFSGAESEKHASGALFAGGKGKTVVAGALLPARLVRAYLHTTVPDMIEIWRSTVLGHLHAGALGYNGHFANGLAGIFIACGQDVANLANAAIGITAFEATADGDLYASVTLPSLTVATVGGGTGLGTGRDCLELLGCAGTGGAPKLAEIIAATALAGELSMAGALASGEFVAAHDAYGRNRPAEAP